MSTVQVLILIIIALFIIVMLATFFFLPIFIILNTVTPGLEQMIALHSKIGREIKKMQSLQIYSS
ncbi:MAG: hypothetical protein ACM3X1_04235, partial [Ignavibacteriales bacterium]